LTERAGNQRPHYLPTEAEIAAELAAIQAEWSDQERALRWTGPTTQRWLPPGANRGDCVLMPRHDQEPGNN
jgi:hypothetical protein